MYFWTWTKTHWSTMNCLLNSKHHWWKLLRKWYVANPECLLLNRGLLWIIISCTIENVPTISWNWDRVTTTPAKVVRKCAYHSYRLLWHRHSVYRKKYSKLLLVCDTIILLFLCSLSWTAGKSQIEEINAAQSTSAQATDLGMHYVHLQF